jgi:hypothetical protein
MPRKVRRQAQDRAEALNLVIEVRFDCPFCLFGISLFAGKIVLRVLIGQDWSLIILSKFFGTTREHIREEHSVKHGCIYCPKRWNNSENFEKQLRDLLKFPSDLDDTCISPQERLLKPECMTDAQEQICWLCWQVRMYANDKEAYWIKLYCQLFPVA